MARTTTVNLPSTRDTSIYSGSGVEKSNGGGVTFIAGTNNSPETRRGLVHFDVSGIPANVTLESVSLKLTLAKAPTGDTDRAVSLHRALASWGENPASDAGSGGGSGSGAPAAAGDATWLARFFDQRLPWTTAGGDFAAAPSATARLSTVLTDCTWSGPGMLADVHAWVSSPANNFGWFVLGDESASRTNRQFFTHESTTPGTAPTLMVTYSTPQPQAATYLLIGGAVVLLLLAVPPLRRRLRARSSGR